MLPGWLRNTTRQGILATPDSTYEWRRKGEHVKLILIRMRPAEAPKIEVYGRLTEILVIKNGRPPRGERPDHMLTMVAGTGFEPVTFRL